MTEHGVPAPAEPNDERSSKCSEESRRAQIAREQAMTPEARQAAAERLAELADLLRADAPNTPAGSAQAVLSAMAEPPRVREEDVAALLDEIDRGKRPVQFDSPLDTPYVELFNRLGRAKDPRERAKLAEEISRLTFGS